MPSSWLRQISALFSSRSSSLALILGLGLTLRLVFLWARQDQPLWLDEPEYLRIAQAIRQGQYLDNFRWLRPPLYPLWLALTLGARESLLLAYLAQIGLGVLLVYLLYRLAWAGWGDARVARLSGLLAAVYLPLIAYSAHLMADTLLLVVLCLLLLAWLRLLRRPSAGQAALSGMLLGAAALTKPIALALLPALAALLWYAGRRWRTRMLYASLALLSCALLIAPWSWRNWRVHERFILLDTTGGYNAWIGNLPPGGDEAFEQIVYQAYPNLADRDEAFRERALANMRGDPGAALRQLGAKLVRFWRTEADLIATRQYGELALVCPSAEPLEQHGIHSPSDAAVAVAQASGPCGRIMANLAADMLYLALLFGVLLTLLWLPALPLVKLGWLWVLPIYGVSVLTITQPRIRMALIPVLIPCAAAGLLRFRELLPAALEAVRHPQLIRTFRPSARRRVAGALLALVLGAWFLNAVPLLGSQVLQVLGRRAWATGDVAASRAYHRAAASWYPTRISTLVAAGQAAEALGNEAEALAFYRAATAVRDYEAQARIGAARILAQQGNLAAAEAELRKSLLTAAQLDAAGFAAALLPLKPVIDLGGPPAAEHGYSLGFYAADQVDGQAAYRWMGPQAMLRFGTEPSLQAAQLELRLSANRPAIAETAWLELLLNDHLLGRMAVGPGWHVYRVLVPPTPDGVSLTFRSSTFVPAQLEPQSSDTRSLGVAVDWARLVPLSEAQAPR